MLRHLKQLEKLGWSSLEVGHRSTGTCHLTAKYNCLIISYSRINISKVLMEQCAKMCLHTTKCGTPDIFDECCWSSSVTFTYPKPTKFTLDIYKIVILLLSQPAERWGSSISSSSEHEVTCDMSDLVHHGAGQKTSHTANYRYRWARLHYFCLAKVLLHNWPCR